MNGYRHTQRLLPALLAALPAAGLAAAAAQPETPVVVERLDIEPVWAGHPVGFCLLTAGRRQYAVYYDAARRISVAQRALDARAWRIHKLDGPGSVTGWDSHNYLTLALDARGLLHLSGNMHCRPLLYWRSERPWDAASLRPVHRMVGTREGRCTYPRFLRGPDGRLVFHYRDGSSGNGVEIYNVYDAEKRSWLRLLDTPLTDGLGRCNAYHVGPLRGPDGWYHMSWVWRDTPDCQTNHDLSYARSRDLRRWQTADGKPIRLPITPETPGVVVDPVPPRGGMINGNGRIGFDTRGRVILSYHKFDADGNTQAYNARLEAGRWHIRRVSDWSYRWFFQGRGSIRSEIGLGAVLPGPDETLEQAFRHVRYGAGIWRLDPTTLRPLATLPPRRSVPPELGRVESDVPGMQVRWAGDTARPAAGGVRYVLRWETLPRNRDRPRPGPPPKPSMLRLYKLTRPRPE